VSESLRSAAGRKVISRADARDLGVVGHLLVDAAERRIAAIVIGRGRKAQLIDWSQVTGFGPDAVMVIDDGAVRAPIDDRERAAAAVEMVGRRVLTEHGTELGMLDDVTFDAATGTVEMLRIGDREIPAGSLLGSGPYAVVVDAGQDAG